MKQDKNPMPNNFLSKFLNDSDIKWITNIFNNIYDADSIPQEWLKPGFVKLPEKSGTDICEEYRTMSQLLKVFQESIHIMLRDAETSTYTFALSTTAIFEILKKIGIHDKDLRII